MNDPFSRPLDQQAQEEVDQLRGLLSCVQAIYRLHCSICQREPDYGDEAIHASEPWEVARCAYDQGWRHGWKKGTADFHMICCPKHLDAITVS